MPLTAPSEANLIKYLRVNKATAAAVRAAIRATPSDARQGKYASATMEVLNRLIEGHGVESLTGTKRPADRSYFWNSVALYVNTGDTYNSTILFDTVTCRFHLITPADFIEKKQRSYGIE